MDSSVTLLKRGKKKERPKSIPKKNKEIPARAHYSPSALDKQCPCAFVPYKVTEYIAG